MASRSGQDRNFPGRETFPRWKATQGPVWNPLERASVNLDGVLRSLEILERYVLRVRRPLGEPTLYPPLVDLLAGRLFELQVRCRAAAVDLQGRLPLIRLSAVTKPNDWQQRNDLLALFQETDRHLTSLGDAIRLVPTDSLPQNSGVPLLTNNGNPRNQSSIPLPAFRANREGLFGRTAPPTQTLLPGYEPLGPVPSSLPQTRLRFLQGLNPAFEEAAVERYRLGRYQFLASARAGLGLTVLPLLASELGKRWFYQPAFRFLWNTYHPSAFLSEAQQHVAMQELRGVEASLYFEEMLSHLPNAEIFIGDRARELQLPGHQETILHQRRMEVLERYNAESIDALVTLAGDLTFLVVILVAFVRLRYEIIILRGVLTELFFALDDPQKCFLLYYGSELLVGYHSKNGWEVGLRAGMHRVGLEENEQVIKLAIATVPVMIDTLFKYWVFRHLNRLSPTTTATYYQMIESSD